MCVNPCVIMDIDDETLLKSVKKFPQLYNKCANNFKDKIAKENAWQSIAFVMNDTVENCERRFTTLRNRYTGIKRKLKNVHSGSGCSNSSASSWPLYESMSFLDSYIVPRRSYSNRPRNCEGTKELSKVEFVIEEPQDDFESPVEDTEEIWQHESSTSQDVATKRCKVSAELVEDPLILNTTSAIENINKMLTKTWNMDHETAFCNNLVFMLKDIKDNVKRKRCMAKIIQTVYEFDEDIE